MDEQAAIGVVGTQKATPYGIKMARKIGYEITKCGGLVVTGLAEGIDSAAAEGALHAEGACVGVLGGAIEVCCSPSGTMCCTAMWRLLARLSANILPAIPLIRRTFLKETVSSAACLLVLRLYKRHLGAEL